MECGGTTCNPSGAAASLFLAAITSLTSQQCSIGDTSIYPPDRNPDREYDFIVVGGGTAGCVVANRLSSNPAWKVLLMEAGDDPPYTSEIPSMFNNIQNTDADWGYVSDVNGPYCLGMKDQHCRWGEGKALGGSSVLNSMIYLRGNPRDFDQWQEAGNDGWSYNDMKKYFDKSLGKGLGGDVGFISLAPFDKGNLDLLKPLRDAAIEIGNRATLDEETLATPGYFTVFGTVVNGTRSSVAKAYLAPVRSRPNLHIVKKAVASKIIFNSNKRAVGIEYEKNGNRYKIHVKKEVIVSSGAFASAQLLMLSGIGWKRDLERFGIRVVADLRVGYNMNGHIQVPAIVASINRGVSTHPDATKDLIETVVQYLVDRQGKLSGIGYGQFVGFIDSTHSRSQYPDNQIKFSYYKQDDYDTLTTTLATLGYSDETISSYTSLLKEADLLVITPSLQHPKSYGQVLLRSSDPKDPPGIFPGFFQDHADLNAMFGGIAEGMKLLRTCALKSAARVEPRALLPRCLVSGSPGSVQHDGDIDDSSIMDLPYWRCMVKHLAAPDFLPAGTCKMGPRSSDSVVDARLRVHLVRGVRVVDAAIMPGITTGETMGALVALAEKGAAMIKEDWKN